MLGIIGTQARRLPGASQFPWKQLGLGLLAIVLVAAIVIPVLNAATDLFSGKSAPAVQPNQQVSIAPAVSNPQVPQNVQKNVGAAAPVVVDYRVVWVPTGVSARTPNDPTCPVERYGCVVPPTDRYSTLPVEEGLYNGRSAYASVRGTYAWKILPHLEGFPVAVAAARDEKNKEIVLVALDADRYGPFVLLSVDGEKSWCMLNLLLVNATTATGRIGNVRVVAQGEEIHLYSRDSTGGLYWWTATVKKSELPCS